MIMGGCGCIFPQFDPITHGHGVRCDDETMRRDRNVKSVWSRTPCGSEIEWRCGTLERSRPCKERRKPQLKGETSKMHMTLAPFALEAISILKEVLQFRQILQERKHFSTELTLTREHTERR
ncbi:unnamed protein product [Protopolystoma xenopodis]|uniref:Uncharacterized protein n=1 Tax=Protopolystoma xenopodis TaxID=117903 RepID=A0A3S5CNX5_9PLAT|nr:unnamed protein product [Protopolystoma xenopodis]